MQYRKLFSKPAQSDRGIPTNGRMACETAKGFAPLESSREGLIRRPSSLSRSSPIHFLAVPQQNASRSSWRAVIDRSAIESQDTPEFQTRQIPFSFVFYLNIRLLGSVVQPNRLHDLREPH